MAIQAHSAMTRRGRQPTAEHINVVIDNDKRMIHAEILEDKAKTLSAITPPRKRTASKKKNP